MRPFSGLDICRFLCAVSILVWHYAHFFYIGPAATSHPLAAHDAFPFHDVLASFYRNGDAAVQMFWTLSGFIFFWRYGEAVHRRAISAADFAILRFSRLYPLHLATFVAVAALQALYLSRHGTTFIYEPGSSLDVVLQLGLVSHWLGDRPFTFNGPAWSISVEVLAYIVFFAAMRLARPSASLCLAIVLSTTAVLIVALLHGHLETGLSGIQCFFTGGLLQTFVTRLRHRERQWAFWLFAAGAAAALTGLATVEMASPLLMLAAPALVVGAFALLDGIVDLSRWSALGAPTYAIYLMHFPLQLAIVLVTDGLGLDRALFLSPTVFLLYLVLTLAASFLVHHGFERPAQAMIRMTWRRRLSMVA